mmetsp:Transcript_62402/g.203663  ORF Transcript_62402/g.203663 Transcript_62402/m.203663 type:complete len:290 (-) Transcript_62402:452-1321(-)
MLREFLLGGAAGPPAHPCAGRAGPQRCGTSVWSGEFEGNVRVAPDRHSEGLRQQSLHRLTHRGADRAGALRSLPFWCFLGEGHQNGVPTACHLPGRRRRIHRLCCAPFTALPRSRCSAASGRDAEHGAGLRPLGGRAAEVLRPLHVAARGAGAAAAAAAACRRQRGVPLLRVEPHSRRHLGPGCLAAPRRAPGLRCLASRQRASVLWRGPGGIRIRALRHRFPHWVPELSVKLGRKLLQLGLVGLRPDPAVPRRPRRYRLRLAPSRACAHPHQELVGGCQEGDRDPTHA